MAIRIDFMDKTISMLDFIGERSYGLARESLSVTGAIVQKKAKTTMRSYTTYWHSSKAIPKGAKKVGAIYGNENRFAYKTDEARPLGTMTNHKTDEVITNNDVANVISSYLSPRGGLSVTIGGAHKSFKPIKYENGVRVGTLKEVKARGSITRAIFHKLETGEITKEHPYYNRRDAEIDSHTGKISFEYETNHGRYKARPFMADARRLAKPVLIEKLTKRYNQVLPSTVANISENDVKMRTYSSKKA